MRVLLICDDHWHPGKVAIDGIAPLIKSSCPEDSFQFDIITNANDFSTDMLKEKTSSITSNPFKYSAVLLCKSNEISGADKQPWKTETVQKAFADYVGDGGGLVAVHSGVVKGEHTETLDKLIGCYFLSHPEKCPVTVQPLKPHPVTKGVDLFCETDEHYKIEIISPDADILLASYSPAAIHPAGYVRTQGKGRVCVLTPGHTPEVWSNPQFQKLLTNALKWVSGTEN